MRNTAGEISDKIATVIEVKGCWHPRLHQAMKDQLVDQYLKHSGALHGLYLVGWFACDKWDDSDPRKNQQLGRNVEETKKRLKDQAEQLSESGVTIRSHVLDAGLYSAGE
jgi:hypothetical protein